jgi:hypothetical protein
MLILKWSRASIKCTVSKHTTGENNSKKLIPSTWEKPLATRHAFFWPSVLMSKTHLFLIILQLLGRSVILKTSCLLSALSLSRQAFFHSSCSFLGSLRMSWKLHSLTEVGLEVFSSCNGTAFCMRKLMRPTPPSCAIWAIISSRLSWPSSLWLESGGTVRATARQT